MDRQKMMRGAGILLPVFSLPSKYGIGTLGKAARDFIDFLVKAKQSYWQVLPQNPTGYGNSPYNSFSAFAGNPYFIDLETLISQGLLMLSEVEEVDFGSDPRFVDYGKLYENRIKLLSIAKSRDSNNMDFQEFKKINNSWLYEYALFMSIKQRFGMTSWLEWPSEGLRKHDESAIRANLGEFEKGMELYAYIQYQFFKQWFNIKKYANERGIQIIGDIPIYISVDSADFWSCRKQFLIDEEGKPTFVAGVPPDAFSSTGQLWGNPIYNWGYMKENDYQWWQQRLSIAVATYDIIRFDHFRGFESFWAIEYGQKSAEIGDWMPGPGREFFDLIKLKFPSICAIAENLGYITSEVDKLLEYSGFYGMNVLEFAFDSDETNIYLPDNQKENSVCYTGTHDNSPLRGWFSQLTREQKNNVKALLKLKNTKNFDIGIIKAGMQSPAQLFIAQMQDYLRCNNTGRINNPAGDIDNWRWRLLYDELNSDIIDRMLKCAEGAERHSR